MTSYSFPSPAYNVGAVTELEFERLSGSFGPDGLIGTPAGLPFVFADGTGTRRTFVRADRRALLRGFMWDSGPSNIALTHDANTSGATRIDLVVLRLDRATWTVTEAIVKGTPGAGAPPPTTNTGSIGVYEIPLAEVTVTNNATAVTAGQVVNRAWYVGDDGQILCTSTTRPPHAPGRRIRETDTGRVLESNGVGWVTTLEPVAVTVQFEDYSNFTFTNTAGQPGSPACGGTFVAPLSGKVIITVSGNLDTAQNTNAAVLGYEVKDGGVVGSGNLVLPEDYRRAIKTSKAVNTGAAASLGASHRRLLAGLTAGGTYNARTKHWVDSGGGGNMYARALLIEPVLI